MVNKSTKDKILKLCCRRRNEINFSILDKKDNDDEDYVEDNTRQTYKRTETFI